MTNPALSDPTLNKTEHRFAPYIRTIGKGKTGRRSLSQSEAHDAMQAILNGQLEPVQLGAFLMVLRVKEESAEEIAGFVESCRAFIHNQIKTSQLDSSVTPNLDWSSYAGKKRQPPWYLLSALLLAQAGYKVFMHGAKGHTPNRLYTEDVLIELGFTIASDWQRCQQQLDEHNFCYLPIQQLCRPLHDIIELRPLLGLRSPVHTLVRLLNPLGAEASLQSVFHPSYSNTHHQAALLLNEANAAVFKGEGGEVEYRPQAELQVQSIQRQQSQQYTIARQPTDSSEQLPSASALLDLWHEEAPKGDELNGYRVNEYGLQAVIGTTAIALKTMGVEIDIDAAFKLATELWQQRDSQLTPF